MKSPVDVPGLILLTKATLCGTATGETGRLIERPGNLLLYLEGLNRFRTAKLTSAVADTEVQHRLAPPRTQAVQTKQ